MQVIQNVKLKVLRESTGHFYIFLPWQRDQRMEMKELGFPSASNGSIGDWREGLLPNGPSDAKAEPRAGEELQWMNQEHKRISKPR